MTPIKLTLAATAMLTVATFNTADAKPRGIEFKKDKATEQIAEATPQDLSKVAPAAGAPQDTKAVRTRQFKNH